MGQRSARIFFLICFFSSSFLAEYASVAAVMLADHLHFCLCPCLFVFGASMVDSGTNAVAMPYRSNAEFDPYGSDYFGKPVGRWSNGRTFMDIITQSLGLGLLDPFIKSIGSNFTHGVNFASSGSTAQNTSASTTDSGGLFSLLVQVEQFREYQSMVLSTQHGSRAESKMRKRLSNSIYFLETAHNDYLKAGIDADHLKVVKLVIASMRQAFEVLYNLGARMFIVMNVTPLGCSPSLMSIYSTMIKDEYGCIKIWNDIVSMHNHYLIELLDDLQSKHPFAKWIVFDAYSIFLNGYHNPSNYGLKYPYQACCGAGGIHNFNKKVQCGQVAKFINGSYIEAKKCVDPTLYLIWDSIHPVESFGKYIAEGVLYGTHLSPDFNISAKMNCGRVCEESGYIDT